jgi:hypothetical protein
VGKLESWKVEKFESGKVEKLKSGKVLRLIGLKGNKVGRWQGCNLVRLRSGKVGGFQN